MSKNITCYIVMMTICHVARDIGNDKKTRELSTQKLRCSPVKVLLQYIVFTRINQEQELPPKLLKFIYSSLLFGHILWPTLMTSKPMSGSVIIYKLSLIHISLVKIFKHKKLIITFL